jgi:hypothetical protein
VQGWETARDAITSVTGDFLSWVCYTVLTAVHAIYVVVFSLQAAGSMQLFTTSQPEMAGLSAISYQRTATADCSQQPTAICVLRANH